MASEFFNWTFVGAPVSVDLDLGVLERLKRRVLAAGDCEQSGILLGSATPDSPIRVRITGFRPGAKEKVREMIEECRTDGPASPVGYYCFRGRERIHLDQDDLAVAASCFKDPGDVFLVARAEPSGEATAGLFFWDEGQIHSYFSFLEFPLSADALREPAVAARPGRNLRWALAGVGVLSILALAGLVAPRRSAPDVSGRRETLGLRYEVQGSFVRVGWDKSLASIATARSGVLSIREDARETTIPLTGDQLRTGAVFYAPTSGGESVRLRLEVTDSGSHRISEDLTAVLPPKNVAAKAWPRGMPEPRRGEAARDEAAPAVQRPAPKPFQTPASRKIAGEAHTELPELPAVALSGAAAATLPFPAAPAPIATGQPTLPKGVVYVPPKPVRLVRPVLPSSVAAMVYSRTRIQVKVSIDRNGNVVAAEPVASDPKSRLLGAIVATAARGWHFDPARRDGVAVPDELVVNVDFEPGGK